MTNPYWWFDNPLLIASIEKMGVDIEKLKEQVTDMQSSIEVLSNYVNHLDETVRERVIYELNSMVENGEMAAILNELLVEDRYKLINGAAKSSKIDFRRMFRIIYNNGANNSLLQTDESHVQFSYGQGSCYFERGNHKYLCIALGVNNGIGSITNGHSNEKKIVLYQIDSYVPVKIGEIVSSFDHANSIAYNDADDCIYIVHLSGARRDLTRIEFINFTNNIYYLDTHTLAETISWYNIRGVACYNGDVYLMSNQTSGRDENTVGNIVVARHAGYNNDGQILLSDAVELDTVYSGTCQDFSINDNYIAVLYHQPSQVRFYDRYYKKIVSKMDIPYTLNGGIFRTNEVEAITLQQSGDLWMTTAGHLNQKDLSAYTINQLFRQNIYNFNDPPLSGLNYTSGNRFVNIWVDHDELSNIWNPDGSETKPFAYPMEAIQFIECNPAINAGRIVMKTGFSNAPVQITTEKPILIQTWSELSGRMTIGGIYANGCSNLGFSSLNIVSISDLLNADGLVVGGIIKNDLVNHSLVMNECNFSIYDCTFNIHDDDATKKYLRIFRSTGVYCHNSQAIASGKVTITHSFVNGHGQLPSSESVVNPS